MCEITVNILLISHYELHPGQAIEKNIHFYSLENTVIREGGSLFLTQQQS